MSSPLSHLQATLLSVLGAIATVVVAVIPAWSPEVTAIVAAVGGSISLLIPLVNVGHQLVASRPSVKDLESDALDFVKGEIGKVDFNGLASSAVKGQNIEALVKSEIQKLFSGLTPVPVPAAPPVPTDPPVVTPPATS